MGERKINTMWVNNSNLVNDMTCLGLALKCDTDLGWFNNIVWDRVGGAHLPTEQVGKEKVVKVGEVKELLIKHFSETFHCETLSVEDCMKK